MGNAFVELGENQHECKDTGVGDCDFERWMRVWSCLRAETDRNEPGYEGVQEGFVKGAEDQVNSDVPGPVRRAAGLRALGRGDRHLDNSGGLYRERRRGVIGRHCKRRFVKLSIYVRSQAGQV